MSENVDETEERCDDLETVVQAKFKPRARLLLQLGDQLIKNESIALIELVKNSYDADANHVEINMADADDPRKGLIIVHDNGFGMDLSRVLNVWLEPGSDFKSKLFKERHKTPKYKRLPIGEKGIGRFGAHKLGYEIEMTTKKAHSKEVFVKINWRDFEKHLYLDDVPINVIEREEPLVFSRGKTGTNIVISDLRVTWDRATAREIKCAVAALTSPFETIDSFTTTFEVLDKPGWFEGLLEWKDIKDFALFRFKAVVSGDQIKEFEYEFSPWASMSKLSSRTVRYSSAHKERSQSGERPLSEKLIESLSKLSDEAGAFSLKEHVDVNGKISTPKIGDVVFEGYIFDRDSFVLRLGVSDKKGFRNYLDANSGVRVFRDGLRVYDYGEPENDWLDLNLRRVNQPDKKLSKNIILGAVYLNRSHSSHLVEKTNREGFIDNDAYRLFKRACTYVLGIVEDLRYTDKIKLRKAYGPSQKSEPVLHILGDLKDYVDAKVKEPEVRQEITKYLAKIESDYKRVNENLLRAAGAGLSMSVVIHEIEKIISEVDKVVKTEKASERVISLVKHLSSLIDGYAEIVRKSNRKSESLKEIINQALFNTEYRLSAHKVEVIRAYKSYPDDPRIEIARNLLVGSLMNVIDNSIYWLEKAASLNSNLERKILIDLHGTPKLLTVLIADNGTGFMLPTDEITEPFVSAKTGGMGLGLHIASEIMLAQGGRLLFPDKGDFELPTDFGDGAVVGFELKRN